MTRSVSSLTLTCKGGCGRKVVIDAQTYDAWSFPETCLDCLDRQMDDYYRTQPNTTQPATAPHKELIRT